MAELIRIEEPSPELVKAAVRVADERIDAAADAAGGSLVDGDVGSLAAVLAIRRAVFVGEQGVDPTIEWDDKETTSTHLLLVADRAIGTARLRALGPDCLKCERIAVRSAHRGGGWGGRLMDAIETIAVERGAAECVLHAQRRVEGFYEKYGYVTEGEPFEEAGIPHVKMRRSLDER